MVNNYVAALKSLLISGQEPAAVFANLRVVLKAHGHSQLESRIVRTLDRELGRATDAATPVLTVLHLKDASTPLVKQLMKELMVSGTPEVRIDETLVGGAKLRANHQEIDATYKTALLNLYHTITK